MVLSLLSIAVINTMTKSNLEGKAYFSFCLKVPHEGKSAQELKAGTQAGCAGTLLTSLLSLLPILLINIFFIF